MRKIFMKTLAITAVLALALTANAQTLTLNEGQNEISAADQGSYDRVEYIRQTITGTTILASFPAQLDGYYFGPDAKRFIAKDVKEYATGAIQATTEEMADDADFQPGVTYLITPTQDLESIICLTPGKKTDVVATSSPLIFQTLNTGSITAVTSVAATNKTEAGEMYDLSGRRVTSSSNQTIIIQNNRKMVNNK